MCICLNMWLFNTYIYRMSLFNKPKRRIQARQKLQEEGSDDDESTRIGDIRELQRSRERKNGMSEIECAVGKEKAAALVDGIQMAGGTMAMTGKQKAKLEAAGIEAGIREQFEKETLLRDEDEELRKYIDQGLKGGSEETIPAVVAKETDVLQRAASKLKAFKSETGSELLSEHMLAGIPEVDLGISVRITNILETEKRKKELLDVAMGIAPPPKPESDEKPAYKRRRYTNNNN